jgi:hypothetical protein
MPIFITAQVDQEGIMHAHSNHPEQKLKSSELRDFLTGNNNP